MLIESLVLGSEDGLFHDIGHILDMHDGTALFAEFADQIAVRGINAQRSLGAVVGENFQ